MNDNKIKYQMFCSNCKTITPHFVIDSDQDVEHSKVKTTNIGFINELINFFSNTTTYTNNVDKVEYICSVCNNKYLDIY